MAFFDREVKAGLRISWYVMGALILAILIVPAVVSAERIYAAAPRCEWKTKYGRECFMCGMTTAFVEISRGRPGDAQRSNRGSVPLYSVLVMNEAALALRLGRRLRTGGVH
jgi:hypothetical protein